MFYAEVLEKIETHISRSITPPPFFFKSCRLWDNVQKYGRAGVTTQEHIANVLFT